MKPITLYINDKGDLVDEDNIVVLYGFTSLVFRYSHQEPKAKESADSNLLQVAMAKYSAKDLVALKEAGLL
jgi:hypothetical protein